MDMHAHGASEPPLWILVFTRDSKIRWLKLLTWGGYNHVKAFAFVPDLDLYLFYDVAFDRTGIVVAPNTARTVSGYLADFVRGGDLMAAPKHLAGCGHRLPPFTGWCVPAMKRLIGLRGSALRPSALWRDCLKAGGTPLGQSFLSTAVPAARP